MGGGRRLHNDSGGGENAGLMMVIMEISGAGGVGRGRRVVVIYIARIKLSFLQELRVRH